MNLNESGMDKELVRNALETAVLKYDSLNYNDLQIEQEENDLVKFKSLIETSKYFPVDQLQSFTVPTIIQYLKTSNKYISCVQLSEIQDLFHDLVLKSASINSQYEEIYQLFFSFKRLLSGHIGVSIKQLYPFANFIHDSKHTATDMEELHNRIDGFRLDNFVDNHGTDPQILLARIIFLLKESIPEYSKITLYKTLVDELAILKRVLYSTFLIEQDVLIPKINRIKKQLNVN